MKNSFKRFLIILGLVIVSAAIAVPEKITLPFTAGGVREINFGPRVIDFSVFGRRVYKEFKFKQGLDIQGGMQVVLQADMSNVPQEDRVSRLDAAKAIILRRVDLYGIAEPVVQTAVNGDDYRLLVELPGVDEPEQALELVGQTAQLEFKLVAPLEISPEMLASNSANLDLSFLENAYTPTGLTGKQLQRASAQFDPNTREPVVSLEFNEEGRDLFAKITEENIGERLAIFIDDVMILAPVINTPIVDGRAIITGSFSAKEASSLSIQLNAGALPMPIQVLEQRSVGASLGQASVQQSIQAGVVGVFLVMVFMILYYGAKGFIASIALSIYAVFTLAIYKSLGVTLSLPGIAGLLLSIGMAVDSNILIFERMKEELRAGKPFAQAMELGFGRAWDSIKDANLATIVTAIILINPMSFPFLNTAGMVRGFGITLLIGVVLSLFTGVFVTRTLMRLFLSDKKKGQQS